MSKQRLIWADSLKGWLMILVIVGHAIQWILKEGCNDNHVWNLIYSFHMPAFMDASHTPCALIITSVCLQRFHSLTCHYCFDKGSSITTEW